MTSRPRYIFYGIIFLLLIAVLILFLVQPGRYEKNYTTDETPAQLYQSYLSNWSTPNKTAFTDCIMGYTETDKITSDQVQQCAKKVGATP